MSPYWQLPEMIAEPALQDLFVGSSGRPIDFAGHRVIQLDRIPIPEKCEVVVSFIGERIYQNNAAVIAVRKPGRIFLSDGKPVGAVAIWDAPDLPRTVRHPVESGGNCLEVYNKYRLFHSEDFITEDKFTGNAGMVVTEIDSCKRRYQCSNGDGAFSLTDLVFEVSWELR